MGTLLLVLSCFLGNVFSSNWDHLELPPSHLQYLPEIKKAAPSDLCWGFEPGCLFSDSYTSSIGYGTCDKGKENNHELFHKQADFGYVSERAALIDICQSDAQEGTSLRCSDDLRYCYAKNILFDLRSFNPRNSKMYRNDIIHEGEVGGNCQKRFDGELLKEHTEYKGYLTNWAHELEHFTPNDGFKVDTDHCDVIFDRPTVVMKLDAAVNMYHHFCDFVNLYASQHINGSFGRDVDIVWWETGSMGYKDSTFGVTWKAFSSHQPVELISLAGKRVCFREAMLPLLARQRHGLFYNTVLVCGRGVTEVSYFRPLGALAQDLSTPSHSTSFIAWEFLFPSLISESFG